VAGNSGLAYFAGNAHWGITEPACRPDEDRHQAELRHIGLPPQKYRELISFYGLTDPRVERLVNGRFKEHVRTHPVDFGKKLVLNGIEYYAPVIYYVLPPAQTALSSLGFKDRVLRGNGLSAFGLTAFNLVLVFLALAGASTLFQQRAMRPVALVLLAAWAAFMVPYFPFLTFLLGRSCYPFGTFPIISLLAAVSLVHKFPKVRGNELPNSVVQPS
jgi:hypothetical protein